MGSWRHAGFSLVEIILVIVVLGILTVIGVTAYQGSVRDSYHTRADVELQTLANATKLYATKYNEYPADANRGIPAGLNEFIRGEDASDAWPSAPWPESIYDYDAWDLDSDGKNETFQVSIRFCPAGGPISACTFPQEPWVQNFDANSAYYYCIKGYCRAHQSRPVTHPGYCVNCPNNQGIPVPETP